MKVRPTKKTHQGDVRIDRRSRNGGLECMKSLADMIVQIGKESEKIGEDDDDEER